MNRPGHRPKASRAPPVRRPLLGSADGVPPTLLKLFAFLLKARPGDLDTHRLHDDSESGACVCAHIVDYNTAPSQRSRSLLTKTASGHVVPGQQNYGRGVAALHHGGALLREGGSQAPGTNTGGRDHLRRNRRSGLHWIDRCFVYEGSHIGSPAAFSP